MSMNVVREMVNGTDLYSPEGSFTNLEYLPAEKNPMPDYCPGAANLRTPTLTIKKCPQCGEEVEVFSSDVSVRCSRCGFKVYNDMMSCIQWCKHAQECVGPEMYRNLTRGKKP
jgi:NADH pyrophosphatase NudC (nudix superfamily)